MPDPRLDRPPGMRFQEERCGICGALAGEECSGEDVERFPMARAFRHTAGREGPCENCGAAAGEPCKEPPIEKERMEVITTLVNATAESLHEFAKAALPEEARVDVISITRITMPDTAMKEGEALWEMYALGANVGDEVNLPAALTEHMSEEQRVAFNTYLICESALQRSKDHMEALGVMAIHVDIPADDGIKRPQG